MVVLEVGMILYGLPVFRADYHQEVKGDPTLRSGMFAAIQTFAKEAFGAETEELILKNLSIYMVSNIIEGIEITLYAVCDKQTKSIDVVRKALKIVGSNLMKINKPIDSMNIEKNEFLRPIFEKEFKNLRTRPSERIKDLFGP